MKTVKRTDIGSFELDMTMYDVTSNSDSYRGETLRINHSACEEVKVVHNKDYDLYMTVVKTYDGSIYYIKL